LFEILKIHGLSAQAINEQGSRIITKKAYLKLMKRNGIVDPTLRGLMLIADHVIEKVFYSLIIASHS